MELVVPLQEHQPVVEGELRALLEEPARNTVALYKMMQYQLGWVDGQGMPEPRSAARYLHGALCLEAARTIAHTPAIGPAAAAIELLYKSVSVHEDMQLGAPHLESRPAVWWIWGPAQAINVGDGLHALARLGIFRMLQKGATPDLTLRAVAVLDAAALRYYEGQFMELTFQERIDIQEAQYFKMVEAKQGSLLGGAMALGACAAGGNDGMTEAFRRCGEIIGLALQLHDDMHQLWDNTEEGDRAAKVLNKSKLFPVVHALEKGTLADKRALGEVYFKRVMEPTDLDKVRRILQDSGAKRYTEERQKAAAKQAMDGLAGLGLNGEALQRWQSIVQSLTGQKKDV